MVQGGSTFVKYLLFFFNLLFLLTGLAVIIVGGIVQYKAKEYFNFLGGSSYASTAVLLIVVGVIIFIVTFFGCCGAYKENHCMVMTFSVLLFLVFIMELSGGIAAYAYKGKLRNYVVDGMTDNLNQLTKNSTDARKTWDEVQSKMHCCGVKNASDYTNLSLTIPLSCCKPHEVNETVCENPYKEGCADKFFEEFDGNIGIIGGVGIGIAFVQVIGIVFACCLARAIKKQYEVV